MQINTRQILGFDSALLTKQGGALTAAEINQQPAVWTDVAAVLAEHRAQLDAFLAPLLAQADLRIILTGAGTSAFIGKCIAPLMLNKLGRRVEAIPTTDLVSGPSLYFQASVPTLMVSFARSGSSPESLAAVELANQCCASIHHLIFTCNEQGELYLQTRKNKNGLAVLLPLATHDRGFAMTSSFTSMFYSACLAFKLIDGAAISQAGSYVIANALPLIHRLVAKRFERVIYLGSNELRGLAEEAALKLLELSDGQVLATFDSPLGFRHGPKTMINDKTLVVVFLSNHETTRNYDLDLLRELQSDGKAGQIVALSAKADLESNPDYFVVPQFDHANALELVFPYVVFAQLFALLQSLAQGNTPDQPSKSGTVNRVVQGVTIYPLLSGV
ncbi:tagatose-6-phosphate ketose/aldose isomerase [Oxalobacteraceae bacterium GrIS 2.11]